MKNDQQIELQTQAKVGDRVLKAIGNLIMAMLAALLIYAVATFIGFVFFHALSWFVELFTKPSAAQFLVSGPWNIPDLLMWIIKFIDWFLGLFGG